MHKQNPRSRTKRPARPKTKRNWQLQEAKNRLSEVVQLTLHHGPQVITLHGKPAVVVVSVNAYEKLKRRELPLVDFLLEGLEGANLELKREKYPVAEIEL